MSAESYAEEQFNAVKADPAFVGRNRRFGVTVDEVLVVDDRVPIGEVLARLRGGAVVAVDDEDAPHGFELVRISGETK